MIVVDSSVLASALGDDGPDGDRARAGLYDKELAAPELIELEVTSVLRGRTRAGKMLQRRARQALTDLAELPLHRASHGPLLPRIWELRNNLSVYDAAYVALAEFFDACLLTADMKLARATGPRCTIDVLPPFE